MQRNRLELLHLSKPLRTIKHRGSLWKFQRKYKTLLTSHLRGPCTVVPYSNMPNVHYVAALARTVEMNKFQDHSLDFLIYWSTSSVSPLFKHKLLHGLRVFQIEIQMLKYFTFLQHSWLWLEYTWIK